MCKGIGSTVLESLSLSGGGLVSSMEEVEAAEARMNAAKDALVNYIETGKVIDRDRHRRLVAQLKKAQAEFLRAISDLGE